MEWYGHSHHPARTVIGGHLEHITLKIDTNSFGETTFLTHPLLLLHLALGPISFNATGTIPKIFRNIPSIWNFCVRRNMIDVIMFRPRIFDKPSKHLLGLLSVHS